MSTARRTTVRTPYSASTSRTYVRKSVPVRTYRTYVRRAAPVRTYVRKPYVRKSTSGMKYPGAGASIGSTIGSAFGPAGSLLGGTLGDLAHKLIHKVTGFGSYQLPNYGVTANKLLETNDPPVVKNDGKEFIIRHREYIGDIYSGVAGSSGAPNPSPFKIDSFSINPGLIETFPWLSNVASRFEEYAIEGMLFEYKSLYSDAAVQTGGSLGAVIMATSYNAAKPLFASKIEMENYEFAQSSKPSVSMCHPIECAKSQNVLSELYVRTSGQDIADQDIKMYDFGRFQIASQGIPCTGSALSLGELWVTYQIRFLKPRISDYLDSGYARFYHPAGVQPAGSEPFDPSWASSWIKQYDNIGVSITGPHTVRLPLRSGERTYQFIVTAFDPSNSTSQGAAVGWFTANPVSVFNGVVVNVVNINNPTSTVVAGAVNTSGSSYICHVKTDALAPGKTFCDVNFPVAGMGAGLTMMKNIIVHAVPALP